MKKYKIYCTTDLKWETVIASVAPTACPTNGGHTVTAASVACVGDALINDGTPTDLVLADYKQLRYNEIDGKTGVLISAGFTYDSATFSTSVMAQANWSSIKENTSDYTFPLLVSTKDSNEYSLAEANVTAFWTAGRDYVKGHLDSGRALKKSVFDAVDKAAVDAVIDNR